MTKKLLIGMVMMVVMMLELPLAASASSASKNAALNANLNKPQISIQLGNRRRSRRYRTYNGYRNYGQYRRNNNYGAYRRMNRGYALVPQYYWMDGRRYVRYVRTYNRY